MKKMLLMISCVSVLVACGNDNKNDDLIEYLEGKSKEAAAEDERARKAMDMSGGATVYELPPITFGKKENTEDKE